MSDHQRSSMGTTPLCGTCDNTYYPCPTRILTDLIAELRDFPLCSDNGGGDSGLCGADDLAGHLADRAEARLREVQGE